ncbi:hypothetical protein TESG_08578 [Trichophyton tonsurans CBS 112818]|uniref:Uncharacterized protein n=1 Tax=Trichophyton tonsurans (strain CBS 112818) TaxID=647933 RepID=F2S657_TRIT1|nr:hypothetical protein TESG_08578 [Trichophyton tonsurans CBS 112818]
MGCQQQQQQQQQHTSKGEVIPRRKLRAGKVRSSIRLSQDSSGRRWAMMRPDGWEDARWSLRGRAGWLLEAALGLMMDGGFLFGLAVVEGKKKKKKSEAGKKKGGREKWDPSKAGFGAKKNNNNNNIDNNVDNINKIIWM